VGAHDQSATDPTEYEPPELLPDKAIEQLLAERPPQTLSQVIEQLTTGATSTAFETRNTGLTMQAKAASVRGDNHLCDVSLSFEEVQLLGFELFSQNRLSIPQPHFTHFRSTTLLRTTTGRWQLLSAQAPPPTLRQQPSHNTWITILRVDPVP